MRGDRVRGAASYLYPAADRRDSDVVSGEKRGGALARLALSPASACFAADQIGVMTARDIGMRSQATLEIILANLTKQGIVRILCLLCRRGVEAAQVELWNLRVGHGFGSLLKTRLSDFCTMSGRLANRAPGGGDL